MEDGIGLFDVRISSNAKGVATATVLSVTSINPIHNHQFFTKAGIEDKVQIDIFQLDLTFLLFIC